MTTFELPNVEGFDSAGKLFIFIAGILMGAMATGGMRITDMATLLIILGLIAIPLVIF